FLATIDLIRAKAELARQMQAIEPTVDNVPMIDWTRAVHPLLKTSLEKQGKQIVPLDIRLEEPDHGRLLIISGPNAGGKSVCLKTAGLLQYMLQCGLSVPVSERSRMGIFQNIMIDIGDEQSIENDLSTYSSHLLNMKNMMRQANGHTLLLIDEFGGGTEPQIGGAIAEAVLKQFWKKGAFGIITTHYQNLKHFSEGHPGVVNGAMLYDRQQMQALFQLSIGQPGSSFAIEIARKTGIPEEVISDASEIVGRDYIQSDKYLQDIVRDKRYWEGKRQTIHQREKEMLRTIERYESDLTDIEQSRKAILRRAQEQAEEMLSESNRRIESAIREIRESQAQKEETRRIREELESFRNDIKDLDTRAEDEKIAKKIAQLQARKERKEKRKKEKANQAATNADSVSTKPAEKPAEAELSIGQTVRIKGLQSIGKVESISGKMVTVIFGDMRTKMRMERLEPAAETKSKTEDRKESLNAYNISRETRETIDSHRQNFRQDLDVRGMRGDEALNAVTYFIDDAILMGMSRVRILHGKGNGILRQLIRQYLSTVPNVTHFADEHVQFGGTGITVVDF
ncbi:MAG: Smr/MutS family protein, partial [Prevotella sp.]|nr:Smr/MutS family protein [Prevotella sp.]